MRRYNLLVIGLVMGLLAVEAFGFLDSGKMTGTVTLDRAKVITDGPKSFKHVVVSLEPQSGSSYEAPLKDVEMDQRGLVFLPHVMAVQVGTPVDFLNSDNDRHNVYFLFEDTGETLDIGTWGPGQTVTHTFDRPGVVITLCQLHLEMAAYILLFDHPFFVVAEFNPSSQTAEFEIENVPPGNYVVTAWHKKLKMKGGALDVSFKPGEERNLDIVLTKKKYAK